MRSMIVALWAGMLLASPSAFAQHNGGGPGSRATAPAPEVVQFDFLIGQWELTVRPAATSLATRIHGAPRLSGTWKAWRALDGFGVEDELRIVDGSGNPITLGHAVRVYDPAAKRWAISGLDVYRSRFTSSTAIWTPGEMVVTGASTDQEGKPITIRTRFFEIAPAGFRMEQDRSTDGGRTWAKATLRIDAKRVAAIAPR